MLKAAPLYCFLYSLAEFSHFLCRKCIVLRSKRSEMSYKVIGHESIIAECVSRTRMASTIPMAGEWIFFYFFSLLNWFGNDIKIYFEEERKIILNREISCYIWIILINYNWGTVIFLVPNIHYRIFIVFTWYLFWMRYKTLRNGNLIENVCDILFLYPFYKNCRYQN